MLKIFGDGINKFYILQVQIISLAHFSRQFTLPKYQFTIIENTFSKSEKYKIMLHDLFFPNILFSKI